MNKVNDGREDCHTVNNCWKEYLRMTLLRPAEVNTLGHYHQDLTEFLV